MLKSPEPVLSVSDATLAYGNLCALNGISLQLFAGELLGLLGPNGAGKSSLIRCVAGRQQLDSGAIAFHRPGKESSIALVPQEIAVYHDLSVQQNLQVFGRLCGVAISALRDRVNLAIEWAGLRDKQHQLAGRLSGGMQRRLNIACSVLHEPDILLLDEPTVGVDPQSRERIYEMVHSLLENQTSVLLTTHHLDEAQHRCDRMVVIDHGRVVATGTFDELVTATTGRTQLLSVRFSDSISAVPEPLRLDRTGREAHGQLSNISVELPILLHQLQQQSLPVDSLTLRGPTLQNVFLHLTGRELRE